MAGSIVVKERLVLLMWYIAVMLLCDALSCDMTHYHYNVIVDNTIAVKMTRIIIIMPNGCSNTVLAVIEGLGTRLTLHDYNTMTITSC